MTAVQERDEYLLVELPGAGAVFIGVGQGRAFCGDDTQMRELALSSEKSPEQISRRIGPA